MNKSQLLIAISVAFLVSTAHAGSIMSAKATPASATLPAAGPVTVSYAYDIKYFNNETFGCGARLSWSDGAAPETLIIKAPMQTVVRSRQLTSAGNVSGTLTGFAYNGLVACLGSQTATATLSPKPTNRSAPGQPQFTGQTTSGAMVTHPGGAMSR